MKRTVLITGASGGIGLELAHIFASKGANLVLVARSKDKLDTFKLKIGKKYGVTIYNIGKDLTTLDAAREVFDEISKKQIHIDFLINNAGFGDFGHFAKSSYEKQLQMINLNVTTLTLLTHLFLPDMIKAGYGKILNVASTAAFQPGPTMSVYFATKAYVLSFSEAIAHELSKTGVTVTVLCPGATETGFKDAADLEQSQLFKNKNVATAKQVAEFGFKKMMKGDVVVIHGFKNKLMAKSARLAPRKLVVAIAKMTLRKK